ncbi:hypothetical protein A1O1_04179 [Capronia coronata CBS 617.96]|uniref:DH domain-containing protein n=1 Tax=Capronia coronata CBS 617.96 TaxID=1182541 RepID=W9YDW4_9EURO|nr:uncharacterized protein A1O1_04179 [Capronia coronata CBS 617.96]EXJ91072.1 hypothetical protein A1O1_04179 [Capronia coronata CBS 617.96]
MRAEASTNTARRTLKGQQSEPPPSLRIRNVTSDRTSGLYDSNSVQDRIRQWQAQGAANATAPDAVSVRSIPYSECASTVSRPKSEYGDENAVRAEGRTRQKSEEEPNHSRSRSAPRKRIISDSHWKAKREARDQKNATTAPKIRPLSTHYDLSYTSNQEKRGERRRSQRHKDNGSDQPSVQTSRYNDGIRVTAVPDAEGKRSAEDVPPHTDLDSQVDDALARQLTTGSKDTQDEFSHRYSGSSSRPEEHGSLRRRSKYAEMLEQAAPAPSDKDAPRSRKPGLLGRTKDMFAKSDQTPSLEKRLPSIEAWLDEQPDPFVDEPTTREPPAAGEPQPLRRGTERKRTSTEKPYTPDPNKIWESIQPEQRQASSAPSTKRQTNADGVIKSAGREQGSPMTSRDLERDDQQDVEGSPSSLRRRGARHRRERGSPRRKSLAQPDFQQQGGIPDEELSALTKEVSPSMSPQRPCPPTGAHRLSTIASVETFAGSHILPAPDQEVPANSCDLKRKLTTHEDLMSVLSLPGRGRSRRSVRSKRSTRGVVHSASVQELTEAFVADEERYVRELRTLVDGVIPVLLQSVLSKTDSAIAAGLFTSSTATSDQTSFTKPIIDMGIALERLKTLHSRVSGHDAVNGHDVDSILSWAQTAQRAYKDYIQAWRLGFQDIVINLAPLDNSKPGTTEAEMARDESGDLVDTDGKKVDVAYLLKRPLVRVKALSKTFTRLKDECDSPVAARVADIYIDLTAMAKRRHQEERARLEDEAAANIDAMRVRDIRTMAAITGVVVNKSRRVKARDFFSLTLYHSSGQRMDCGVELIFRDNARGEPAGGDVLICEVDDTGKWLLFAPVELGSISARRGEGGFDLVVMLRGRAGLGQEWHELLALKSEDSLAVTEWMTMLGSNPLPPRLNRTSSFVKHRAPSAEQLSSKPNPRGEQVHSLTLGHVGGLEPLDVPLGEPSIIGTRTDTSQRSDHTRPVVNKPLPRLNLGGGLASKPAPQYAASSASDARHSPSFVSSDHSTTSDHSARATITTPSSNLKPASFTLESSPKQTTSTTDLPARSRVNPPETPPKENHTATRKDEGLSPMFGRTDDNSHMSKSSPNSKGTQFSKSGLAESPSSRPQASPPFADRGPTSTKSAAPVNSVATAQRPGYQRALSSTPSKELPTVSKIRPQQQQPSLPAPKSSPTSPRTQKAVSEAEPRASNSQAGSPTASRSKEKPAKRRTSSPLKHEYAPSTSSDESSDYDTESVGGSDSDTSDALMSESGDKPTPLVAITAAGRRPSKPAGAPPTSIPSTGTRTLAPSDSASQGPYRRVPSSAAVPGSRKGRAIALICAWSNKGSWEQIHPDECSIVISPGLIEAFEMSAAHSDPQADFGASKPDGPDSRASSFAVQPLVAFELTPIVALRRGTAIDISIRSPPTANSRIKTTSIVMFRSRNPEECEVLYGMINWARCNNPTYIQLQSARPQRQPSVTFNVGQDNQSRPRSSSWFNFGSRQKSSYRASSAPTPASVDISVESSGTMASAFSALKRFGASSAFNLNRSTVTHRAGNEGTAGSLYSSSSGTGTGSGSSTPAPSQLGFVPGKDGPNVPSTSAAAANGGGMVNNMKIRLYVRKGQHWENLGAARLSVLPTPSNAGAPAVPAPLESRQTTPNQPGDSSVEPSPPTTPTHSRTASNINMTPPMIVGQPGQKNRGPRLPSANHTPHRVHGNGLEKRVLITRNRDPETVLLDAVLGESCFERIMQTGIAVKVWTETQVIGHTGGVTMGRETVYMMQFPGAGEATWVFGLCGTNRYAIAYLE